MGAGNRGQDARLRRAAANAVRHCLRVKKTETVLVVTDPPLASIGEFLWEAARRAAKEAVRVTISERKANGSEPPAVVAEMMQRFDVVLVPTSKSMSHTEARRAASAAGVRCATLPGITADCMARTLTADYRRVAETSTRVARTLSRARDVCVTTPAGTELFFSLRGRKGLADTGMIHKRGAFGNLPAGEGFAAPLEGTANGLLVVDGSMAGVGLLKEPLEIEVRDGNAVTFRGGGAARRLARLIRAAGDGAGNIAEFGVGTNPRARVTGQVLEDEKVLGTIHIALGDNVSMGGTVSVRSHLDGVLLRPTVRLDGRTLLRDGRLAGGRSSS